MAAKRKKTLKIKSLISFILLALSLLILFFLYRSKLGFKSQAATGPNADCSSSNWSLGCYYTDSGSYYLFGENDGRYYTKGTCYGDYCRYDCVGSLDPGVACGGYKTWAAKVAAEKQEKDKKDAAERKARSHPKGRTSVLPF